MAVSKDGGMLQLLEDMSTLSRKTVRVGVLVGSATSDSDGKQAGDVKGEEPKRSADSKGRETRSTGITQVEVFRFHELGEGVPKRESLSWVMDNERQEIQTMAARVTGLVLDGKMRGEQALGFMGENIIKLTKQRIRDRIPPGLEDSTLAKKTRGGKVADIPLIHLGQFIRSFRWNIVNKGAP